MPKHLVSIPQSWDRRYRIPYDSPDNNRVVKKQLIHRALIVLETSYYDRKRHSWTAMQKLDSSRAVHICSKHS